MITVIAGTNRANSEALFYAKHYTELLKQKADEEIKLLSLEELPADILHPGMYASGGQSEKVTAIQDEYMIPAEKFLFVIPEYNGSFPGVLKLFLDALSIREYDRTFKGKKAALAGIAAGRAGNLRGMEHLTGILNYVGTLVMPNKLPISSIEQLVNDNREIHDAETLEAIAQQVEEFILF